MQFSWKNSLKAVSAILLLAANAAFGAAGDVQFVIGDVKLTNKAGVTVALQKGAQINEGDRIVTAAGASAQIKMIDGGFIAVRPSTSMTFDTYRYSGKEDGTENAAVSLLQGGFRTITGIIGRSNKQNYLIKTDTATIGIRGTDHEPMVILPPAPGQAAIAPPGTYDKVNVGVAFIRTDAGSVDIQRNQVGFAPVTKAAPVILPRIPPFYKPTPAPGPQKAKEESKEEGKADSQQTAAATADKPGEEKKEAAPAEKAAAAPATATAEKPAEAAPAPIRNTAVVDPTTTVSAATVAAPVVVTAPAALAPVVAITATNASGATLNTTTQTTSTASGTTTPIAETPIGGGSTTPTGPVIASPVVAASTYGFGITGAKPVTGGVELLSLGSPTVVSNSANTDFVLSDSNLVQALKSSYQRSGLDSVSQTSISAADVKFSGGTAVDTQSDPNGTYYMGRWKGGQIAVTDLATTSPVAPFTDALGAASVHWAIGLAPGNLAGTQINNVQQLAGTASYTLTAATHPTDGFGNVGTLNSATLSANFSKQTVDGGLNLSFSSTDAANPSQRNLSLTASASNVPIHKSGFDISVIPQIVSIPGLPALNNVVTCSGADCASGGYFGIMGGSFLASASGGSTSGAVGTGVGLTYGFAPIPTSTPTANQPFADFITGAAVLSTAAAPAAATNAVPVTGGTGTYRQQIVLPVTIGSTTYNSNYNLASGTNASAQNYLFDGSGNLLRIQSADYKLSERGTSGPPAFTANAAVPYTGTLGGLPTSPLSAATVSFSGGTAPDGNYSDTTNGIRMGRYAGGTITTTDLSTPTSPATYFTDLGSNSVNWAIREIPGSIPTTGSFEYTTAFATKPTDSLGNTGTFNSASLTANFDKQSVSPAVSVTINNQTLTSSATDVPIASNFGFDVSSNAAQNTGGGSAAVHVSCFGSNCAPPPVGQSGAYGGRFTGGLAGSGAAGGAFFRYDMNTRYDPSVAAGSTGGIPSGETRPVNDYIQGEVAFSKGSAILQPVAATAVNGDQAISTSYFTAGGTGYYQSNNNNYRTSASGYTSPFGAGSPNSVTDYDPTEPSPQSETLTGGTVLTAPTNATSAATTGISFGRYSGGVATGVDGKGTAFNLTNIGNYAWIKGPEAFPFHLQSALTGTATYALDGSTLPTSTGGGTGTLNSANIAVDFNKSAVGVDLSVTVGTSTFAATTGGATGAPSPTVRINGDGGFFASSFNAAQSSLHQGLQVTLNNVSQPFYVGQVNGLLMGSGLSGAGLSYAFQDNSGASPGIGVNGAVAFALNTYTTNSGVTTNGTAAIDVGNVSHVLGLVATGLNADPTANPANAPASLENQYMAHVESGFNAATRVTREPVNGLPIRWDAEIPITIPPGAPCALPCVASPAFVSQTPARFSIDPTSFVATGATPATGQVALPTGKAAATLLESGRDAATGISWGRYGGGVVAIFDRIGGGFAPKTADLSTQNWHGIFSPTQTGPVALPTTGTFSYTKVGGTSPTDNLGSAAGTLNAATLVADFAAQTVNAGVNLTVNGQTWAAGANTIPIQNRLFFEAGRGSSGGNLNICVGGTCGTATIPTASSLNTGGRLVGGFTGSSGQGVGMAYSLNQGGVAGTTVSGVAAFKR
jgi:hypothetical protein